jgi:hypothetical protein
MIPLLFFVLLLFVALSEAAVSGVAGIPEAAGRILLHVLFRWALVGLLTTLLLVVHLAVSDRHPDSR